MNSFKNNVFRLAVLCAVILFSTSPVFAQDDGAPAKSGPSEEELKKANNPLADVMALNIQYYLRPELNRVDEGQANTMWMRFAAPTGPILWRVSAPIETRIVKSDQGVFSETGLGDIDIFAAYLAVNKPSFTFGIGPSATFNTASRESLGAGKTSLGVAAIVFAAPSATFQIGGLLTWKTDVGGDESRPDVNVLAVQPFYFWQLGKGFYFRGAPIIPFDLETGGYHVPLGLGFGKVVKMHNTVFNFFIEPQPSVLAVGVGQPVMQIYGALNMQF